MKESSLQQQMDSYVKLRASLGSKSFVGQRLQKELQSFVNYFNSHGDGGPVRAELVLDWICLLPRGEARRINLLSVTRNFLIFLKSSFPETEIPDAHSFSRPVRRMPYIFSSVEIKLIMDAAANLQPRGSLRPRTYQTLIGLLACTGLRISEAINLKIHDVYLQELPPRLLIRETKFSKSRWVPLHSTAATALRRYYQLRVKAKNAKSDAFFLTERGRQIGYSACQKSLRRLFGKVGIASLPGKRGPCLHSFRHTFANKRLRAWYQAGRDATVLVPNLSVYMGHVNPAATYWYLSATPELLGAAAQIFESYANTPRSAR